MSEAILINVEEVGRAVHVPEEYIVPPIAGARPEQKVLVQSWDRPALERAMEYLAHFKEEKAHVAFYGHVDAWIIMALTDYLRPDCEVDYAQPNHGHSHVEGAPPVLVMPFIDIPVGDTPNPDVFFEISIAVEGSKVFLRYRADDPNKEGMHNFNLADLPRLVLPRIGSDQDLYLFGVGAYPVQVQVTNTFARYARSVSTANHSDAVYHCAVSQNPDIRPGDTEPVRA